MGQAEKKKTAKVFQGRLRGRNSRHIDKSGVRQSQKSVVVR